MNGDVALQFVDTNILVYAHDRSAGEKQAQAAQLINQLWADKTGCISVQVLQEFYVTVTRKVTCPLDSVTAAKIVEQLSYWQTFSPTSRDVLGAIQLQQQHQLSFWDALIVWSAVQLGCQTLWSEDLNAAQIFNGTQVLNPFN